MNFVIFWISVILNSLSFCGLIFHMHYATQIPSYSSPVHEENFPDADSEYRQILYHPCNPVPFPSHFWHPLLSAGNGNSSRIPIFILKSLMCRIYFTLITLLSHNFQFSLWIAGHIFLRYHIQSNIPIPCFLILPLTIWYVQLYLLCAKLWLSMDTSVVFYVVC